MSTLRDALVEFALEKKKFMSELEDSELPRTTSFVKSAFDLIRRVENGTYKQTYGDISYAANRLRSYRGKIMDACE